MTLETKGLTFSYDGKRKVLDDVSFSVSSGQAVAILGRNGAGKTTLFKNLLGLLKGSGQIMLDGTDLAELKAKDRAKKLAYIPQESSSVFPYSVFTTVLMGTTNNVSTLSTPGKKEEDGAWEALERFGIRDLAHRKLDSLSGGERQLVLCARAVAQNAPVLLFDEPTSSLDWGNQIRTLHLIKSLVRDGYIALVSTHNLEQALNWADRLVLIEGGRVVADASPAQLASSGILSSFYSMPLTVRCIEGRYICFEEET